jgi:hypothetical protein
MTQFHFLIEAEAAKQLAADIEAYPYGPQPLANRPVHARIVEQLRQTPKDYEDDGSDFVGPHVLCHVSLADKTILDLWMTDPAHDGRPWRDALQKGLDDGGRL